MLGEGLAGGGGGGGGGVESGTVVIIVGVHPLLHLSCRVYQTARTYYTVCLFREFVTQVGMLISLHGRHVHVRLRLVAVRRYTVAVWKTHYPLAEKQAWIRPRFDIHLLRDFNDFSIVKPSPPLENCALMN